MMYTWLLSMIIVINIERGNYSVLPAGFELSLVKVCPTV